MVFTTVSNLNLRKGLCIYWPSRPQNHKHPLDTCPERFWFDEVVTRDLLATRKSGCKPFIYKYKIFWLKVTEMTGSSCDKQKIDKSKKIIWPLVVWAHGLFSLSSDCFSYYLLSSTQDCARSQYIILSMRNMLPKKLVVLRRLMLSDVFLNPPECIISCSDWQYGL